VHAYKTADGIIDVCRRLCCFLYMVY